ncbi:MAG: VWA domain-containing protein [Candidatus Poribacteria bacterium]|nr:VWA domain-containing protein [Candidatus Poribacteria bacterium]
MQHAAKTTANKNNEQKPRVIGTVTWRKTSKAAWITSLVVHGIAALILAIMLLMRTDVADLKEVFDVSWVEMETPPEVKKRLKVPEQPTQRTDERFARRDPERLMKQANNPMNTVIRETDRVVQNVEINDAPVTQRLPELMTAVDTTLSTDVTAIARMQSLSARPDGQGKLSDRARSQGSGLGSQLYNNDGTDGALGGGGNPGINDPLNIIDFLKKGGATGKIVYVLDVSASMGAAGLYKLELAKSSLIDHIFLLTEQDSFNVVTFSARVARMQPDMSPATGDSMSKAKQYLDRFTQETISDNLGTNTLGALQSAFAMKPDVVVLLTDGLPTSAQGQSVETSPDLIIRAVKQSNVSGAALFIIGLEIDHLGGPGELLLRQLASQTGGRIKFVSRDDLVRFQGRMQSRNVPN